MNIKDIVIIGGGLSIKNGISLGLKDYLKDKFVIGCNYSFRHFDLTALCFVDKDFYLPTLAKKEENKDKYPDIHEELGKLPLIIGVAKNPSLGEFIHPNTILVKKNSTYSPNPVKFGFMWNLCGLFALQLAGIFEPEKIFLLGFDWNKRDPKTIPTGKDYNGKSDLDIHYYGKEIIHRGSGYLGFYEPHSPNNYFKWFNNSKSKIYNVSPNSNIQNFEKIDYTTMFSLLSDVVYDQNKIREEIREKLFH